MSVCWCHNLLEIGRPKNSQTFFSEDKKATFSEVAISKFSLRGRTAAWQQGRMAENKTVPYFDHGRMAAWPQRLFAENILN